MYSIQKCFIIFFLMTIIVSGCGEDTNNIDGNDGLDLIIGSWKLDTTEDSCSNNVTTFYYDGSVISKSGESEATYQFTIKQEGNRHKITQNFSSDNGKDNCQGLSAEFVKEHSLPVFYIKFSDSGMKYSIFGFEDEIVQSYQKIPD